MKAKRMVLLCIALSSLGVNSAYAAAQGVAFIVNDFTSGSQFMTDASVGANGDHAVVWQDATRAYDSFMKRYDVNGTPLQSGDWYIGKNVKSVAIDRAGNFVLTREASDGSENGVFASVYNRDGALIVNEFRVNTTTAGNQVNPVVAMNQSGQFVVAWTTVSGGRQSAYARLFQPNGLPLTGQILVSDGSLAIQSPNDVAIDRSGNFSVTWTGMVPATNQWDVFIRRYNSNGVAPYAQWRVNMFTTGMQEYGRIAMNANGEAVVVWQSYNQDGSEWSVHGQRFDSTGSRVGGEFQVNTFTRGSQRYADVAMSDDGSFVVSYQHVSAYGDPVEPPKVYNRQYRKDGTAFAAEYAVNTGGANLWAVTRANADPFGNMVNAWGQAAGDYSTLDVLARRYVMDTVPAVTTLTNNQTLTALSDSADGWRYYKIVVPVGATSIRAAITGSAGDANLYVRYAALPTLTTWDGRTALVGNNEAVQVNGIPAGDWYVAIHAASAYSGVTLNVMYY